MASCFKTVVEWVKENAAWLKALLAIVLVGGGAVVVIFSGILLRSATAYYWDASLPCQLHNVTVQSVNKRFAPQWTATFVFNDANVTRKILYQPGAFTGKKSAVDKIVANQPSNTYCVFHTDSAGAIDRMYLQRPGTLAAFGITVGFLFMYSSGIGLVLAGVTLVLGSAAIAVVIAVFMGLPYLTRLFGALGTACAALSAFSGLSPHTAHVCASARSYASGQIAVSILLITLECAIAGVALAKERIHVRPAALGLGGCLFLFLVFELVWLGLGAKGYPWDNACNAIEEAHRAWRLCVWAEFFASWTPALYLLPFVAAASFYCA